MKIGFVKQERNRMLVICIFLLIATILTYYFHGILKLGLVFTHFFYVPIILASLWWQRKALAIALFLGAILLLTDLFLGRFELLIFDCFRTIMFSVVACITAIVSEEIKRMKREKDRAYDELKRIFDTAGDGMWVIDKDFNVVLPNHMLSVLLRRDQDEIIGQKCYEILRTPICRTSACPLVRILKGESHVKCEIEIDCKDGTKSYCMLTASPLWGRNMEIGGIVEDFKDITENKRIQEALQQSEGTYQAIFETTGTAMLIIEEDGTISMVNREFEKIFGYSKAETEGKKSWFEFIAEDDLRKVKDYHYKRRADRESVPVNYEFQGVDREGNVKTLLINVALIPGTKKSVASVLDITERKLAEMENLMLATAVEHAAEGITVTDRKGIIRYVNPAFERISGYGREEIIGQHHRILKSSRHDDNFYRAMWQTLRNGNVWSGRMHKERKDGTPYEAELSISPILDSSGNVTSYVAIERDVTKEIELQTQLRQMQKMEAIGTLAGGIAHDFNNILGAIIGYAEMAVEDVSEDQLMQHYLKQVLKAAYRGRDLVKQIITFARKTEEERRPLKVIPILKEALKLLRASLPTTIDIRFDIKTEADMIMGDPSHIHQLLMNLCSNAAHAMREKGGVLEVRLNDVWVDSHFVEAHPDLKPGPYLKLTVSDTGHGMDPATMERIFEPFFTTKKPGEGTGLGLAVVHGIVKSYGGTITVYSEVGKGSTFNVFLPRLEENKKPKAVSQLMMPRGSERILLVDDEEDLLDMMQRRLERLGYRVIAKRSSLEALKVFEEDPDRFDLVITDQTMPQMTGAELAKRLMRIRPDIPIILCTGFSEVITPEDAKTIGIRAFLMKPITAREIAETVRRVIDERV